MYQKYINIFCLTTPLIKNPSLLILDTFVGSRFPTFANPKIIWHWRVVSQIYSKFKLCGVEFMNCALLCVICYQYFEVEVPQALMMIGL